MSMVSHGYQPMRFLNSLNRNISWINDMIILIFLHRKEYPRREETVIPLLIPHGQKWLSAKLPESHLTLQKFPCTPRLYGLPKVYMSYIPPMKAFTCSTFLWPPKNLYTILPSFSPHQNLHILHFSVASTKLLDATPALPIPSPKNTINMQYPHQPPLKLCHLLHVTSSRSTPILHLLQKLFHTTTWIPSTSYITFLQPLSACSFTASLHHILKVYFTFHRLLQGDRSS